MTGHVCGDVTQGTILISTEGSFKKKSSQDYFLHFTMKAFEEPFVQLTAIQARPLSIVILTNYKDFCL